MPGQTFKYRDTITFTSRAYSGTPPYIYNWSSNIDGNLGNIRSFTRSDLSLGEHTICLTVTDNDMSNDTAQITIFVKPPDTTPPVITNVIASGISTNFATIRWNTDEVSDSLLKYGIESGNYTLTRYNADDVISHTIALTGLNANTIYYYVVNSTDQSSNSNESAEYNFTTLSAGLPKNGDINHDSTINMLDAIHLAKYYTGAGSEMFRTIYP